MFTQGRAHGKCLTNEDYSYAHSIPLWCSVCHNQAFSLCQAKISLFHCVPGFGCPIAWIQFKAHSHSHFAVWATEPTNHWDPGLEVSLPVDSVKLPVCSLIEWSWVYSWWHSVSKEAAHGIHLTFLSQTSTLFVLSLCLPLNLVLPLSSWGWGQWDVLER